MCHLQFLKYYQFLVLDLNIRLVRMLVQEHFRKFLLIHKRHNYHLPQHNIYMNCN